MTEQTAEQFPCPPAPRTEVERLAAQVAELQGLLEQAERDAVRALHERDAMRERVSEPNGCTHCGHPKRSHARRYLIGIGMHEWEPPTDEQVKNRMLARRAARQPLEAVPLVVARFDTAMEHAPEEPPGLTVGAIAEDGRPVALVFDEEARSKVAGWPASASHELERLRKERDAFRDQRNAVFQTNQRLIGEVEAAHQARLRAENQTRTVTRAAEELRARVAELEAELARYVGKEPTIAQEMAYLSRCFFAVHAVCDEAEQQARRWENPLPVPEWVATVRAAASSDRPEDPTDNRRRIYLDAKGNGWISVSHEDGTEWVVPVQPAAHVEQDVRDVADETGGLREISRCW